MYTFESRPRKGVLHVLTVGCFAGGLILFGLSGMEGISFPMIYQLSALILLVAGVYLMARYVLKRYKYEISESGITDAYGQAQYDLVVTEITGRRITVVARVGLRDITAVEVISSETDKETAARRKKELCQGQTRVFRYLNSPFASEACYVVIPSESSVLIIPVDEKMLSILRRVAEEHTPYTQGE